MWAARRGSAGPPRLHACAAGCRFLPTHLLPPTSPPTPLCRFHEVSSFSQRPRPGGGDRGSGGASGRAAGKQGDDNCTAHLALNWCALRLPTPPHPKKTKKRVRIWAHPVHPFCAHHSLPRPGAPVYTRTPGPGTPRWFHPPDNLDPSPAGYAQPYTSPFWPAVWQGRALDLEDLEGMPGSKQAPAVAADGQRREPGAGHKRRRGGGCSCGSGAHGHPHPEHRKQKTRTQTRSHTHVRTPSALLSPEEEEHIRRKLYGRVFGLGRRQHLYRHISLHS